MIDDNFKDVLPMDAIVRATEVLKKSTPLDMHNKVRLAIIATGLPQELRRSQEWVEDLAEFKNGVYTRCVYCSETIPVGRSATRRLQEHILVCPKHPVAALKKEIAVLKEKLGGRV